MNLLDFYQLTIIANKKQTRQVCKIKQGYYGLFNTIPDILKICLEIMPFFILISSFNNINWHCSCGSCTASYIGKTYRHFKVRSSEHQDVSPTMGKPVKGTLSTSVRDPMLVCDHKVVYEDFKFFGNGSNRYLLELKERLFIKRDRPSLNKNLYLQELLLFWVFHIG